MKSLIAFSQMILLDMEDRCNVSTSHDFKTVMARVEEEGLSFLSITLPGFGADFQKSLDQGYVDHTLFLSFKKSGGLPRFLGGFLDLIFDRETGWLLHEPLVEAISCIRQFTLMFAKINIPCSQERVDAAFAGFVQCEQEVRLADSLWTSNYDLVSEFQSVSRMLYTEVFTQLDRKIYEGEITPKHGPGATAEKLSSNSKYSQNEWTERLERSFDFGQMMFPNPGWYQSFQEVNFLEPGAERPVRVISVPKTLKTPRVIAIEPTVMQYMQQGLLEAMRYEVSECDYLSPFIDDLNQEPNRFMAQKGSIDGSLATLDLSEASDRVSNQLVRAMLHPWRSLHDAVDDTRSRRADVPGHGILRLAKFASMGSALCFPMEEFVFTTIAFMGVQRTLSRRLTRKDLKSYVGRVRVYGDDIIVPVDCVDHVIGLLQAFGLKVNLNKSFWTGRFRESCGGDYYAGFDVTPVRVREMIPSSREDALGIASTVSLRNLLFEKGYDRAVEFLDGKLSKLLPIYRDVPRDSAALGRWTHGPLWPERSNPRTHEPQIKAPVLRELIPPDNLEDRGALMKYFLKRGSLPIADRRHLEYSGRPVSVYIKTQWVSL